jgi:hypothetical protein
MGRYGGVACGTQMVKSGLPVWRGCCVTANVNRRDQARLGRSIVLCQHFNSLLSCPLNPLFIVAKAVLSRFSTQNMLLTWLLSNHTQKTYFSSSLTLLVSTPHP